MLQRNTPERRDMLAARAEAQRGREPGFTNMYCRPAKHVGPWDPAGPKTLRPRLRIVPAWMNRRTGEPHKHDRDRLHRLGGWLNVQWNNPDLVVTYVD